MTKRKNYGFNKVKTVYIGQSAIHGKVRSQYVELSKRTWNNLPKDYDIAKREVKRILFLRPSPSNKFGARWNIQKQEIIINDHSLEPTIKAVIDTIHELAHAYYSRLERLDPDKIAMFKETISVLNPINSYVQKFSGMDYPYYTEYHSALAEYLETNERISGFHDNLLDSHQYQIAITAYNILHNRNND